MAKNRKRNGLLYQLGKPAVERKKREIVDIQALIDAQKATSNSHLGIGNFCMQNKLRKAKFRRKPGSNLILKQVYRFRKGVFYAAEKFSMELPSKKEKILPVINPDVVAYEVFDRDGKIF